MEAPLKSRVLLRQSKTVPHIVIHYAGFTGTGILASACRVACTLPLLSLSLVGAVFDRLLLEQQRSCLKGILCRHLHRSYFLR